MNKKKNQIQYNRGNVQDSCDFFNTTMGNGDIASSSVGESKVKKIEHKRIDEGGLSRLYTHIKDNGTFAVIGSQDKDTGEDRSQELRDGVRFSRIEIKDKDTGKVIKVLPIKLQGFNGVKGTYKYEDGSKEAVENSMIVYNISKEDALKLGKALNQETILWKDPNFFGYIYVDNGEVPEGNKGGFKGSMSFDQDKIDDIGGSSALVSKGWSLPRNRKSKNKPFVYECFLIEPALQTGYVSEYLIDSYEKKSYIKENKIDLQNDFHRRIVENKGNQIKSNSIGIRESLESEYFTKEEIKTLPDELTKYFQEQRIPKYYDISADEVEDKKYVIKGTIDYGEINHDHRYFDEKVKEFFRDKGIEVNISEPNETKEPIDEDGIYSSIHTIQKIK